ncbi:MAG: hypothetical protein ACC726_08135 [Chloroflexota bacterium]
MTGEPPNDRVTPRELTTLRDDHGRRIGNPETTMNDEHHDPDGWRDTSTNSSRLTAPTGKGGRVFPVSVVTEFGHPSGVTLRLRFLKNGTTVVAQSEVFPDGPFTASLAANVYLADGDYVETQFTGAGTSRGCQLRIRHDDPKLKPYSPQASRLRSAVELASDVEGLL